MHGSGRRLGLIWREEDIAQGQHQPVRGFACLECGVILPVSPDDAAAGARPADERCRDCGTPDRFARRGEHWITSEIVP